MLCSNNNAAQKATIKTKNKNNLSFFLVIKSSGEKNGAEKALAKIYRQ